MNRRDQLSGLVWLLAGLCITIGSLYSLRIGTTREPGPGLFPLIAGISLSLFSLTILIKATLVRILDKKSLGELWTGLNWKGICYVVAALLIYAVMLERIGFLLLTTLLLVYLFRAIEPQKWKLAIGLSILASILSYVVFDRLLEGQLPRGFLGF
jgi:putative tricarboxylic transport membrane protein